MPFGDRSYRGEEKALHVSQSVVYSNNCDNMAHWASMGFKCWAFCLIRGITNHGSGKCSSYRDFRAGAFFSSFSTNCLKKASKKEPTKTFHSFNSVGEGNEKFFPMFILWVVFFFFHRKKKNSNHFSSDVVNAFNQLPRNIILCQSIFAVEI